MKNFMLPYECQKYLCQGKFDHCEGITCSLWNWKDEYEDHPGSLKRGDISLPYKVKKQSTHGYCGLNQGE